MKPVSSGLELTLTTAALLLMMWLVMWAQAPTADCAMQPEVAARRLVLTRTLDREHLARDLASAGRAVRRHEHTVSESGKLHSGSTCEDTLFEAIAQKHGLTADVVRDANQQRSAARR